MDYEMEELLPLVERLTFKYTSGDSSSVTYETARILMEAIIYCLEEFAKEENEFGIKSYEKLPAEIAYKLGYEAVVAKVHRAKELYNHILEEFNDFGCRNLKDTVLEGMPAFFLRYDPKFKPQDHLLTLDYPTIRPVYELCGADAIYRYLSNIKIECDFLRAFEDVYIKRLMERVMPDYKNLYFDNIAYAVLITVLGCIAADKPVDILELTRSDLKSLNFYFGEDSEEELEHKVRSLLKILFQKVFQDNGVMEEYFSSLSRDYAVRIRNGIQNHSLEEIFYLNEDFR